MQQESFSVGLIVLAPVFQQAVVCDMVCFFFLSFQSKNAMQSVLDGLQLLQCYMRAFFYVISHQQYTKV